MGTGRHDVIGDRGLFTKEVDEAVLQMVGCFLMIFFIVAMVGLVLALTSFSRKAHNPAYIWAGVVLNTLVICLWTLLIILGLMRGEG